LRLLAWSEGTSPFEKGGLREIFIKYNWQKFLRADSTLLDYNKKLKKNAQIKNITL